MNSAVVSQNAQFIEVNTWMHVVASVDAGGAMQLFKDGILDNTATSASTPNTLQRAHHRIGAAIPSSGFFSGTIAYLRFWEDAALDAHQVAIRFNHAMDWTSFFSGRIGSTWQFETFEAANFAADGSTAYFMSRLPPEATVGTRMKATISGGACAHAQITFKISADVRAYFSEGTTFDGWRTITDVSVVSGTVLHLPTHIWTGDGTTTTGWVLGVNGDSAKTFGGSSNQNIYDYCNGAAISSSGEEFMTLEHTTIPLSDPTFSPTELPTLSPTEPPTSVPSYAPTPFPTYQPTPFPTYQPTPLPTYQPMPLPTERPTKQPSFSPTSPPSPPPTRAPTSSPSFAPTNSPVPTVAPSIYCPSGTGWDGDACVTCLPERRNAEDESGKCQSCPLGFSRPKRAE